MLIPKIEKVEVLENYELLLCFETGELKIYDMKENFKYKCFQKLKDEKLFKTVKPVGNTIEWETGEDINPEDLYFNSRVIEDLNIKNNKN